MVSILKMFFKLDNMGNLKIWKTVNLSYATWGYFRITLSVWKLVAINGSSTRYSTTADWIINTLRLRQMAAISQTTLSNPFSWMKIFAFRLKFHWSLFLRSQLTIFQHWFRKWLGADQATSHYLYQWWLVYWRIYVSLGLNELIYCMT